MPIISIVFLAVTFLFALGVSWALVAPFFSGAGAAGEPADRVSDLQERRESLFRSLEDLDEELRGAKITPEAYEEAKSELMADLAQCLAMLEGAEQPVAS